MSRTSSQSPSPDWQASLLEAIQHRDASRAIPLAQRCVHRRGMATLHNLLDRADAAAGTQGEARAWLLLLLKQAERGSQPVSAADLLPPEQAAEPSPSLTPPPSQNPAHPPATTAAAPMAMEQETLPEVQKCITPPSPLPPPGRSSDLSLTGGEPTSEALDQAFAPLEIAFPPLPLPERHEERLPSPDPAPAPPPLGDSSPFQEPHGLPTAAGLGEATSNRAEPASVQEFSPRVATRGPHDPLEGLRGASGSRVSTDLRPPFTPEVQNASSRGPAGQPEFSAPPAAGPPSSVEPGHRLEVFSTAVAAPVPSFHVDALEGWVSVESRKRPQAQTPAEQAAPTARAKSLQGWRAWLPGAFRTRPRP